VSEEIDLDISEDDAKIRIADMRRAFRDLQDYLREQINIERAEAQAMRKSFSKLTELGAVMMSLQKAEDAFLHKFRRELRNERDYDHLRDAIGCKIDRIRDADDPETVFRRPDAE